MGGDGSGRWRRARFATTDASSRLGLRELRAHGGVHPGAVSGGTWGWSRGGQPVASVQWGLDLRPGVPWRLTLAYAVDVVGRPGTREVHEFAVEATRPTYGGLRYWLRCACGRRVAHLYLPPGGRLFRCRTCHQLVYQCQRETLSARLFRKTDKMWARVGRGVNAGSLWPVTFRPGRGRRPKGMWRRTYWRIVQTADAIDRDAFVRTMPRRLLASLLASRTPGSTRAAA